jgi:hypothetical protein
MSFRIPALLVWVFTQTAASKKPAPFIAAVISAGSIVWYAF